MLKLTFNQSELVTKHSIEAIIEALGDKRRVTCWYFIKHLLAMIAFIFMASFVGMILLVFKEFNNVKPVSYAYLLLMLFLTMLSFVVFIILAFTKSVMWDFILSGIIWHILFYSLFVVSFIALCGYLKSLVVNKSTLYLIILFYAFVFLFALRNVHKVYVDFRNDLGISKDRSNDKLKKWDKFFVKYGGILLLISALFKFIHRTLFHSSSNFKSLEIIVLLLVVIPIICCVYIYFMLFVIPFKYMLSNYYFLKYKKEYQKKILDEYQIDFCGWEKHKKKYN